MAVKPPATQIVCEEPVDHKGLVAKGDVSLDKTTANDPARQGLFRRSRHRHLVVACLLTCAEEAGDNHSVLFFPPTPRITR